MSPPVLAPAIFDRPLIRARRARIAGNFENHNFLLREVAHRLLDRLEDFERDFPDVLDLGAHDGTVSRLLWGRFGIEALIQAEFSPAFARLCGPAAVVADEEWLPFRAGAFDLIVSAWSLHCVNDLPGALVQAKRSLRQNGVFLAAMVGGDSLTELRQAWMAAESEIEGGISPRVAPFIDVRDAGMLLQRAGFAQPVADLDTLTVTYPDPIALMRDLRGMGETNALVERRRAPLRRATLLRAAEVYRDLFGQPDGRIPATVQLVWLTGRAAAD